MVSIRTVAVVILDSRRRRSTERSWTSPTPQMPRMSRTGLKVSEFASLTTRSDETESVSQYKGDKPNNVWSDLKDLRSS